MANVKADLDALKAKVQAEADVISSVKTLISGLRAQLASALSNLDSSNDADAFEAEIKDISAQLDTNEAALAEAVSTGSASNPSTNPIVTAPTTVGTVANPVVISEPGAVAQASTDEPAPSSEPAPTQPDVTKADVASVNVPGTAGDTTTGDVATAGASPKLS